MEILDYSEKSKILSRVVTLRDKLPDWLMVEIQLKETPRQKLTSDAIVASFKIICGDHDGMVTACNETEVLMLIEWGRENFPERLVMKVKDALRAVTCEATVAPLNGEGLRKMTLVIGPIPPKDYTLYERRIGREQNVILIADDDDFMRALLRAGLAGTGKIVEVVNGSDVVAVYKAVNPDIVLLDIHLPGLQGHEILSRVRALDPAAYIIMVSADSSVENVSWTQAHGARGFLPKPFDKVKLLNYVRKCPSFQESARVGGF